MGSKNEYVNIDNDSSSTLDERTLQKEVTENLLPPEIIIEPKNDTPEKLQPKKKKRLYWADCARIFAMCCIILLHSASFDCEMKVKSDKDKAWIIVCFYNCITRFGVPMFVLLSGTFILDPSKKFSFKKLLRHNILRLVTAFMFWSTVNAINNLINAQEKPKSYVKEFIKMFIVGEEYLWFIFMIIGCYLIAPFLRLFSDDVKLSRYFLGLCVFFGSLVPTLSNLFGGFKYDEIKNEIDLWNARWHFHFTLEFVGYFVAGYHFVKHVNIKSASVRYFLYLLGLIDVAFIVFVTYTLEAHYINGYSHHVRGTNTLTIAFYSIILFIFFKYEIGRIQFSDKAIKVISKWSSLTFGMYLSHLVIKSIIGRYLHITQYEFMGISYSAVIGVPILFVVLTVTSTLLSYIISLIPILNKYLI